MNGKMPSQDLSAWIQGSSKRAPSLPPLKAVSPLSLGDAGANPFTWGSTISDSAKPFEDSIPASLLVDPSDPDPDMFVLGFQELDLSAEALIYSTGTLRENAWCNAVFAALGEKGEKYEKVRLGRQDVIPFSVLCVITAYIDTTRGDAHRGNRQEGIDSVFWRREDLRVRSWNPGHNGVPFHKVLRGKAEWH